jgi:uncharacterized protein YndB with AHSA1/START domain
MLLIIVIVIAVVIGAVLIYAAKQPDSFRIERATDIAATPEEVFALIADFHQWESWSPWEKIDPALKRTYSGPVSGVGAIYAWQGNRNIGEGRMEIVGATPPSNVTIRIDFLAPFKARNTIDFTLDRHGNTTRVAQAMHGPCDFRGKVMGLFFNMEKMVGQKYDEGLANLKTLAERQDNTISGATA